MKIDLQMKGRAPRLVSKKRPEVIRKWPILKALSLSKSIKSPSDLMANHRLVASPAANEGVTFTTPILFINLFPHSRFRRISSSGSLQHQLFSRYLIIRCDFEQRSRDLLVVYPSFAGLFLCSYRSKASTVVSLHSFRSRITKAGTVNLIQMLGEGHSLKLRCR